MESKKTRLHPRNKCDTITVGIIYMCVVKKKIQQKKRSKQKNEGKYDTQRTEKQNIMTNRNLTCAIIERTKKKFSHHMIKCCN